MSDYFFPTDGLTDLQTDGHRHILSCLPQLIKITIDVIVMNVVLSVIALRCAYDWDLGWARPSNTKDCYRKEMIWETRPTVEICKSCKIQNTTLY